ncbi:hypothetical protein [Paraburkholderia sp. BR14427]|uniref:hypothetical protein n=1 Tax=Paraburkholderia sp. BR14427 TaxID=3237008 RepID=UPI0034CEB164
MVLEHQGDHDSQWKVIASIAAKFGCSGETLRSWVRKEERNRGLRPGTSTQEQDRLKDFINLAQLTVLPLQLRSRLASGRQWAAWATPTITHWLKRSTACTRQR